MADQEPQTSEPARTEPPAKKRKPAHTPKQPKLQTHTFTIRSPPYTYIYLSLISSSAPTTTSLNTVSLDEITARTYLTSALNQFLGLTGTAISIDILKVEGKDCWIRVPRDDGRAVIEAVSGWVGQNVAWRIQRSGAFLGGVVRGNGRDLFEN